MFERNFSGTRDGRKKNGGRRGFVWVNRCEERDCVDECVFLDGG